MTKRRDSPRRQRPLPPLPWLAGSQPVRTATTAVDGPAAAADQASTKNIGRVDNPDLPVNLA